MTYLTTWTSSYQLTLEQPAVWLETDVGPFALASQQLFAAIFCTVFGPAVVLKTR